VLVPDYQLLAAATGPSESVTDGQPLNLAIEFSTTGQTWLTELHFWRADTAITGVITGQVFTADTPSTGTPILGTDVTFTLVGTGRQTATLVAPVELTPGRHKAVVHFPDRWCYTPGYWTPGGLGENGVTNGPLSAPNALNALNGQGSYNYGAALAYAASGSANHANYWVDVTVTDDPPGSGGPEEAVPIDVITTDGLETGWVAGDTATGWNADNLATGWQAGELI
jgi:hypothetical protein